MGEWNIFYHHSRKSKLAREIIAVAKEAEDNNEAAAKIMRLASIWIDLEEDTARSVWFMKYIMAPIFIAFLIFVGYALFHKAPHAQYEQCENYEEIFDRFGAFKRGQLYEYHLFDNAEKSVRMICSHGPMTQEELDAVAGKPTLPMMTGETSAN